MVASGRVCRGETSAGAVPNTVALVIAQGFRSGCDFRAGRGLFVDVDAGFSTLFSQTVMTSTGSMGAPGSSLLDEPPACAVELGCGTAMPAVSGPIATPRSTVSYAPQTRADLVTVRAGRPDVLPSPLRRHWAGAQCAAWPLTCRAP